jgi:hypothetical protein
MTAKGYNNRDMQVENRLTKVEESLDEIKNNHLVHLDAKIDKILWFLITSSFGLASGLAFIIFKIQ